MPSKDFICVYPTHCSFPNCYCDQPEKVKQYGAATPKNDEAKTNKWKTGTIFTFGYDGIKIKTPNEYSRYFGLDQEAPSKAPSGGPIETKPVDPNRPRFVYYIGGGLYRLPASIDAFKKAFLDANPHERDAATWFFIAIDGPSRIERLS